MLYSFHLQGPHGLLNHLLSIPQTASSSTFLHSYERVMVARKHSAPFYHVVATDYSVLLMDERFSNHPVRKIQIFIHIIFFFSLNIPHLFIYSF